MTHNQKKAHPSILAWPPMTDSLKSLGGALLQKPCTYPLSPAVVNSVYPESRTNPWRTSLRNARIRPCECLQLMGKPFNKQYYRNLRSYHWTLFFVSVLTHTNRRLTLISVPEPYGVNPTTRKPHRFAAIVIREAQWLAALSTNYPIVQ